MMGQSAGAETVTTGGNTYEIQTLIDREVGPGIRYTRLRLPSYPLNVNMLRIDVTNPYNSIETTQANDKLYGTEALVKASARQSKPGHVAIGGANANFWCVSGQPPYSDILVGLTYNGNVRNGKIITELNMHSDQWNGGYKHTGILGITPDKKVFSGNNWTWQGSVTSTSTGAMPVFTVNKTVRDNELGIYNSYYGTRTFRCVNQYTGTDNKQHFETLTNVGTEVYLTIDEGQNWTCGGDITFTVKESKQNAGGGTIGSYDLAIVGRGTYAEQLNKLAAGDKVTLNYAFVNPQGQPVMMQNLVGGNAQVMVNGEMTKYATSEGYNSQVYPRTGYGCDADNKTLYIIVIDKATDPVYGTSAGCSTTVMCDIAKVYGCDDMTNFDAGGSAEMLLNGAIINKTTESSPRAVANGMIVYNTAPEDTKIARIEFNDPALKAPVYSSYEPQILGYNQYGTLVDDNVQGFELSCPETTGSCKGQVFTAGGTATKGTLTATYNGVSVTKDIEIMSAEVSLRVKPLLIDQFREYPVEATATVGQNTYSYDPASLSYTVGEEGVIAVDGNGVLRGLKDGKTTMSIAVGEYTDATDVTVETATSPTLNVMPGAFDAAQWKTSVTSVKNCKLTADGENGGFKVQYSISSTRGPKITMKPAENKALFSLPEKVRLVINPGTVTVKALTLNVLPANAERPVSIVYDKALTANTDNEVIFDLGEAGDINDLAFYPVSFNGLVAELGDKTGNYSFSVPALQAMYEKYKSGVEDIAADGEGQGRVEMFNLQGVSVDSENAVPGVYVRRQGNKVQKVVVK